MSLAELAMASASNAIESIGYESPADESPRPPRSKGTLNATQTRRLAAIFGMK
jgi:hypothetical protein